MRGFNVFSGRVVKSTIEIEKEKFYSTAEKNFENKIQKRMLTLKWHSCKSLFL